LMQDNLISKVFKDVLSQAMGTLMGSMQSMTGAKGDKLDEKNGMSGLMGNMTGLMNNMTGMLSTMTGTTNGPNASPQVEDAVEESPKFDDAPVEESPQVDGLVTEDGTKTNKNRRKINPDDEIMKNAYRLKPEQIKEIGMHFGLLTGIYTIEKNETETKVTIYLGLATAHSWFLINRGAKIIDADSKDEYLLRRVEKDIPLDKMIIAPTAKEKMIAFTLIFPPLKESVKRMDLIVGILSTVDMPKVMQWDFIGCNPDHFLIKESPKIYK